MNITKQRYKELGDFLKTRRAKILPSQVGFPEGTRRRTPGLRREEVAYLSGVGITWYTWLEQGRPIQVSAQVLESLARVLRLDKQEIIHLYTLARQAPPPDLSIVNETINPMLQHVLDSLKLSPAMILDTRWNIVAWNKTASIIFLDFGKISPRERNILRIMFTNEEYQRLFTDWQLHAQGMLARFRAACGNYIEEHWVSELINELRHQSQEFNLWWPLHNVANEREILKTVNHPILGELNFEHTSYLVSDDTNLKMFINTPLSGTDTEEKIRRLFMKS